MTVGKLAVGKLAAVVVILLACGLGSAAALQNAPAALGAATGHLHHQRHGEGTIGEARTGEEGAKATVTLHQILAAHRADLLGHRGLGAHIFARRRILQVGGKAAVIEVAEHLLPRELTLTHIVQLLLHLGGELQIGDVGEVLLHPRRHRLAEVGNEEVLALLLHIAALQNGGDGGCIGGGTTDAIFLHGADQGRLGIMGRGLGKVLGRLKALQRQAIPLIEVGQGRLFLLLVLVVAALLIHGGVTRELQTAGAGAEAMLLGADLHAEGIIYGVLHLTCQKAAPNEAIELILLRGQVGADALGGQGNITGTDGLVGILRPTLGLILTGLGGIVALAVALHDKVLCRRLRLGRDAERVGTHVGNQTHRAHACNVHAFIELLGDGHGAAGGHVHLAGGLLLQGGGGKGRRGRALLIAALDGGNGKGRTLQCLGDLADFFLVGQLLLLAAHAVIMCLEGGGQFLLQQGIQRPVLLRDKLSDLAVAVIHHAGRHALDAACRQAGADLLPHNGANLITHHAVENAACLLGIHQVHVEAAGICHRLGDHLAGDLVKGHAAGLLLRQVKKCLQMPGNGLTFAVRVGGEIDGVALFCRLLQLADQLFLTANGLIFRGKIVLNIHADGALGQITEMTHAGLHRVVRTQILANGLGLGGRLHDHQMFFTHASSSSCFSSICTVRMKPRPPVVAA